MRRHRFGSPLVFGLFFGFIPYAPIAGSVTQVTTWDLHNLKFAERRFGRVKAEHPMYSSAGRGRAGTEVKWRGQRCHSAASWGGAPIAGHPGRRRCRHPTGWHLSSPHRPRRSASSRLGFKNIDPQTCLRKHDCSREPVWSSSDDACPGGSPRPIP